MRRLLLAALSAVSLTVALPAQASIIQVTMLGTMDNVDGLETIAVAPGESFTAVLVYDDTTPNQCPFLPCDDYGYYGFMSFTVSFAGGLNLSKSNSEYPDSSIYIEDGLDQDSFQVEVDSDLDNMEFGLDFRGPPTDLASPALTGSPLNQFSESGELFVFAYELEETPGYGGSSGTITSISHLTVPEPDSALLIGFSLVTLGVLRKGVGA